METLTCCYCGKKHPADKMTMVVPAGATEEHPSCPDCLTPVTCVTCGTTLRKGDAMHRIGNLNEFQCEVCWVGELDQHTEEERNAHALALWDRQ